MNCHKIVLIKLPERTGDPEIDVRRTRIFATHTMRIINGEWYYELNEGEEPENEPP